MWEVIWIINDGKGKQEELKVSDHNWKGNEVI